MIAISQIIPLLTDGYEKKCYDLGIIQRQRMIKNPADLMLLCLFHLINGTTLIETSEVARLLKIGEFSDVAFMKKFEKCTEWFKWISESLIKDAVSDFQKPVFLEDYRVTAVDASDVIEKGRSGQTFRLHYSIDIFNMNSVSHKITTQEVGETLLNFKLNKGDLVIGDRAYGTINGISHCIKNEADYILRLRTNCFKIFDENRKEIDMLSKLVVLDYEKSIDFLGFVKNNDKTFLPVRVCAKKKSKEACENALKKLKRRASKKQNVLYDKTIQFNEYIVLITSLSKSITTYDVLETYRYRWQVECYFKRLKSIMNFGDLPKKREQSSLSWLNGKIMVALMIEIFMSKGFFSPEEVLDYKP
ncbi:MAG: transposase [Sedimentibacter sp.]